MEQKAFQAKVLEVNGRTITGISAVAGVVDSYNDIIFKGAFKKTVKERASRVRHLWMHDFMQPPTASIQELREVSREDLPKDLQDQYPEATAGLLVKRFYLETLRGEEILAGLKSDPPAINEMSIGYDPVRFDYAENNDDGILIRNLREVRLWDTSDVNWGANSATVANFKTVLPFKDTGFVEELEQEWKAPVLSDFTDNDWESLSQPEKSRISSHFALSKNSPAQCFEDLLLPHHVPSKTGVGKSQWLGTKSAMQELICATHTLGLNEEQVTAVHAHLLGHYEQFKKEAPALPVLRLIAAVGDSLDIPSVKVNPETLGLLQKLNDRLSVEPLSVSDQAALTLRIEQERLLRNLSLKRRNVLRARL